MYLKRKHFSEVLKTAGLKEKRLFNNSNRIGGSGNAMIFYSGEVIFEAENVALIYINTIIVLKQGDRTTLNTDGYQTMTSKKWLNHGLALTGFNHYIQQKKFSWYIVNGITGAKKQDYRDKITLTKTK